MSTLEQVGAQLVIGGGCITVIVCVYGRAQVVRARRRDRDAARRARIAERAWQDRALANSRQRHLTGRNRRLDSTSLSALDAQLDDIPVADIVRAYTKEN